MNELPSDNPKTVVNVSGGNGSAIALMRCIERFGAENVDAVFADTRSEHPDLYRFLDDLERVAGVTIARLSDGRDIWRVFDGASYIKAGNGACKASVELKAVALARYVADRYAHDECQIATGLNWMEPERQERLSKRLAPYPVIYPLNWEPRLGRCAEIAHLESIGLKPCAMYDLGYPHNNCHGACVLAGIGQWIGVMRDFPSVFARAEAWEAQFTARTGFTILRDRRGGDTRPYPLSELRADVAAGRADDDGFREACNCMALERDNGDQLSIFKMLEEAN